MIPDFEHSPLRTILLCGDYGSGKSEVAVNLVLHLHPAAVRAGLKTAIADLDLVNPYFRCRQAQEPLQAAGIRLVAPREGQLHADLPILLPEVKGLLQDRQTFSVLDVGGDEVGARVLASLSGTVTGARVPCSARTAFWFVVNANRPCNDTCAGCRQIIARVESASGLRVSGLVANTHLMAETTPAMVLEGLRLTEEVAAALSVPVELVTTMEDVASRLPPGSFPYPLLPLRRLLTPPWLRPQAPRSGPAALRSQGAPKP